MLSFDVTGFPPKAAANVVTSRVDLRYKNGVYTGRCTMTTKEENLGLLMDCLEVMDWEHTCPLAFCEKYQIPKPREQMGSSYENLKPRGEDWRMEWFSDPDMMDLSYESCRE